MQELNRARAQPSLVLSDLREIILVLSRVLVSLIQDVPPSRNFRLYLIRGQRPMEVC